MLEIKGLSKNFGKLKVLDNININFSEAGIYAVLGPNGSGKTTMIKSILGMVIPDSGQILYNNEIINNKSHYRKEISYLPQIAKFPDNLSGNELIEMVKDIRGQEASPSLLIDIFKLNKQLNKNLKYLSGGTQQKINMVLALMFDSPVLIFDEPTAGLDPLAIIRFKEILLKLKEEGRIIIITTHVINLVEEIAEKIIFLLDGKIHFNGQKTELLKSLKAETLELAIAKLLDNNKDV